MRIYKAKRKGLINYLIVIFLMLPVLIYMLDRDTLNENPWIFLPLLSPFALFIWVYFDTWYKIENNQLIYRSGFLRGKIDINTIREIVVGKTLWSGIKPAIAAKGLIIKYNRFDEVYVAPIDNYIMVNDLLKINPDITINAHKEEAGLYHSQSQYT